MWIVINGTMFHIFWFQPRFTTITTFMIDSVQLRGLVFEFHSTYIIHSP